MPLGMEIGLGPCHIVLDWDPDPPKGAQLLPPNFRSCLLWPNGSMDQDASECQISFRYIEQLWKNGDF